MKRIISYLITAMMVLTMIPLSTVPVTAATGDKYTLNISGSYEYSGPQEMMEYINNLREEQGAEPLSLDAELTDLAMQRAAETAYYFSHTRPNERAWHTISNRANGENIAVGDPSAKETYTQWYKSAGHYANMIDTNFKSIGIGHFRHNGEDFWVQLFSCYGVEEEENRTGSSSVTTSIDIVEKSKSPLEINWGTEEADIIAGDTLQLKVGTSNEEFSYAYCFFDGDSFNWTSSNEDAATVSSEGLVTAVGLGKTTVTATAGSTSITIKINVSKDITKAVISGLDDVEFTGSAIIPPLKVTYDNKILQAGTDYEVTYANNVNAGTARVTIKGINGYTGTVTETFKILRKNLEESVETQLDNWNYTSYGSGVECIEDNLKVYHNGKQLRLDEDYYIYAAYEYPEEGIVTDLGIMFKGNYSGSVWMRCLDTAYARIADQIYTGSALEPEFDLYWDSASYGYSGCKYTKGKDYTVEFENNQEVGTATVKIIPTFKHYGSTELKFKISRDISLAEVADIIDCEYTGSAITPNIKVTYGNQELKEGTDYRTYFSDHIQAGTATVEIEGIGDFAGSVFKNFEIHRYQWVIDKEATEIATGLMHKQCVACDKTKNQNTVISLKTCNHSRTKVPAKQASCTEPGNIAYYVCSEYGILYSNYAATNKITEADTVIPATGHKAGAAATCTTAQKCKLCGTELVAAKGHSYGAWIVDKAASCDAAGSKHKECACGDKVTEPIKALGHDIEKHAAQEPTCTEKGWEAYETCSRCEYTTYKKIGTTEHDIYEVTILASTDSAGYISKQCTMCEQQISKTSIAKISKVSIPYVSYKYNGKVRKPVVTVKDTKGKKLVKGTDYTVTYKNGKGDKVVTPKAVGKYQVVVKFKGNYKGTVTKIFKINPKGTTISKLTKPAKKQIKVTWKKQSAQTTGYQIRYSTSAKFAKNKTSSVFVKGSKITNKTIKKLKSKKKYYVQIRTYKTVSGTKYYSAWSAKKTIKTK